jgi:UDP-N-acetylglucosamine--N-acetylmuramyl-(pentapeptide) pyrophosphoryl-undecaprenol N-acetylglucosamine transferase
VGTPRGLESRLVPQAGHELVLLPILPLNGVGLVRMVKGLLALPGALLKAVLLVRRLKPAAVLGVGGYAGGPVVLAAALLGYRTVVLEPNAKPGFTNRVLKPFVRRAACMYEEARAFFGAKGVVTGNPVRGGFATLAPKWHVPPMTLLAFGGSQGARIINRTLGDALPLLPGPDQLRIVHQTGPAGLDEARAAYRKAEREAEIVPFLDDMEKRFAQADIVLCRSGATTAAELTAAGKASVLVPFALAADDHQRSNARAMEAAGAARMIEEKDLTPSRLAEVLKELLADPARITAMEEAARKLGRPDAADRVADLLEGKA